MSQLTLVATLALAAAAPVPPTEAVEAVAAPAVVEPLAASYGYDNGFFLETADGAYAAKASARVQMRYTLEGGIADEGGYAATESAFSVPRARFKLKGNAFSSSLHYALQLGMGKGSLSLKDAYITYDIIDGWLRLRAGQFKKGFSRQQLTSTADMDLVERAITDKYFGAGRDIGLALMGGDESDGLAWEAGVFNGTGEAAYFDGEANIDAKTGAAPVDGKFTNVPDIFTPIAVGRVSFGYGGIEGNSEGDLEGGPLRFAIGTSLYSRLDPGETPDGRTAAQVDGILKLYGFATTAAAYASVAGGPVGTDAEAVGGHVQLSYVIADQFMPAVRWAAIQPLAADEDLQQEIAAGFSLFLFGHHAKWSTDIASLHDGVAPPDVRARSQLQLAF